MGRDKSESWKELGMIIVCIHEERYLFPAQELTLSSLDENQFLCLLSPLKQDHFKEAKTVKTGAAFIIRPSTVNRRACREIVYLR